MTTDQQNRRPVMMLCASLAAIAILWLAVLPWIAERPVVNDRIEWLAHKGIDPAAMYYTELDAMKPIIDKLERRNSR
ncbi:hypothetical protein Poly51_12560 [Rubripirellula tenax]|uniref:Uncharacterized protein n=1 Tax=Rubripirellula tenax TaxID=2528015 RepID=A0A5C6FAR1_9BACT|nr:hypothetical protein [Rubripirellula tenax]TWU58478.1 hypothetical protein Poly51_12560 [Rubripirellula tenax]